MNKEYLVFYSNQKDKYVRRFKEERYAKRFFNQMSFHNIDCDLFWKYEDDNKLHSL